ncbi:MAG: hypothetical protein OXF62_21890 [Caldilineaceae bacterium]|nr:hypothetical protein [Caldilineaceae bacterium]
MERCDEKLLKKVFVISTISVLLMLSVIYEFVNTKRDKYLILSIIGFNLFNLFTLDNKQLFEHIGHNLFGFSFVFIFLFSKSFYLTSLGLIVLLYTLFTRKYFETCLFDFKPLEEGKEIKLVINRVLEGFNENLTSEYNIDHFLKIVIFLFILKLFYIYYNK